MSKLDWTRGVAGVTLVTVGMGACHAASEGYGHPAHVPVNHGGMIMTSTNTQLAGSSITHSTVFAWVRSMEVEDQIAQCRDDHLLTALNYPDGQRKLGTVAATARGYYTEDDYAELARAVRRST